MLFVLIGAIVAPLAPGQDPYAILGVNRDADTKEIRAAFRVKTRKFHPDVNREPDANRKWILISDAYELLLDPKKREKYDRLGLIDESLRDFKETNHKDKIKTIIAQETARRSATQFGEFDRKEKSDAVLELDDASFFSKTRDGRPWIIYVYNSATDASSQRTLLDDIVLKTGFLFGIAKVRLNTSSKTAKFLKVRRAPQIIVVDEDRVSHFTGELKITNLVRFAAQKFGSDVVNVQNDADILAWRKANLDKVHVLLFSNLKQAPTSFDLVSAFLKRTAVFAFASIDQTNIIDFPRALGSLTLDELPTYIIYRMGTPRDDTFGGSVTPIVAPMDLDAGMLSAIIRRYHYPVFAEINGDNVDRLCAEYCVLWVNGVELADDIKRGVNDMNIPTAMINASKEREFVKHFDLEPGDFIIVKHSKREVAIWKEITTWMTFRRKFELMNNGIGKFSKVELIPKFKNVANAVAAVSQWKVSLDNALFLGGEVWNQAFNWFRKLPVIVVLLVFGMSLVCIGEIMMCLVRVCCVANVKVHQQ